MKTQLLWVLLGIGVVFSGHPLAQAGEDMEGSHMMMEGSHSESEALSAFVEPTQKGWTISGRVDFHATAQGLKVNAQINGAPPGKHGIHIHENGSCEDQGNAAGGHFNPDSVPHGDLVKDGFTHAHAGDLGNIEIDANGKGKLEKTLPGLTLDRGKYGVMGRSLILHEKGDDFGQPTGNAGGRIACAVIIPAID